MRPNKVTGALTFLIMLSISCSFLTGLAPNSGANDPVTQPPIANGNGPAGLTAQPTSADSVLLSWNAVDGATGYRLDVRLGENDFIPLAEFTGDQTSYEAFPVPDNSQLTYRLQAVTSSNTNDVGSVDVTTPEVIPNPLTVQPNEYEPITWVPPTPDPNNPSFDPNSMFPPGFDPNNPEGFDPSALMQPVSASADIGVEGGQVTVTTPDEITYTLSVPAGALDDVTSISLVPIESIDGLPFSGGMLGAVRIDPEELVFDVPATLTITRSNSAPLPAGMLNLTFTFEGSGQEFHLHPFVSPKSLTLNPGTFQLASLTAGPRLSGSDGGISVSDSQSYGAAAGTLQEAREVIQHNAPTESHSNFQNDVAYAQQETDDLAPLSTTLQIGDAILVKALNGATWGDLKKSLDQLNTLQKGYGKDPAMQGKIEEIWNAVLDRLNSLLQHNKNKCLTRDDFDAHALVSQMTNAKKGSFGEQMATRFKNKFGDSVLKQVADSTKNCILDLKINSQITADTPPVKFTVRVEGTISNLKFKFSKGKTFLSGEGVLIYDPIQVIPNGNTSRDYCDPWVPLNSITVKVKVTRLEPIFYPRTANSEGGALKDFKLSFIPSDNGRPSFKGTCTSIDLQGKKTVSTLTLPLNYGKGSLWGGVFTASHRAEAQTGGIIGWEILYDENLAKNSTETDASNHPIYARNIIDNPSFSPGYGTWSEHSEFILTENK